MKIIYTLLIIAAAAYGYCGDKILLTGTAVYESCPMIMMQKDPEFVRAGYSAEFTGWNSPDQYRVAVSQGKSVYVTVSMLDYMRLSGRVKGASLLFAVENTPMWFLSCDKDFSMENISGKTIALPFRGDMPEILLDMLLAGKGVDRKKVRVVSAGGPVSSAQLVMTGRADAVLLPDPMASTAESMSFQDSRLRKLVKKISVYDEWNRAYQKNIPLIFSGIAGFSTDSGQNSLFRRLYVKYDRICRDNPDRSVDAFMEYFPALDRKSAEKIMKNSRVKVSGGSIENGGINKFIGLMKRYVETEY